MIQAKGKAEPAKWEITATTLHCDFIDDLVTITVTRDWLAKCSWYLQYKGNTDKNQPKIDRATKGKITKCKGPDCPAVTKYRDKLMAEESEKD